MLDLTAAAVVAPGEPLAAEVLREEVEARAGVRWPLAEPRPGAPALVLARDPALAAEAYRIRAGAGLVRIEAAGARGMLFGVGGLLRRLRLEPGRVRLPGPVEVTSHPRYPVRGHQLGYRPKNNTYDAWLPERFERYIRDLALFGANFIELLPPRTDDADTNPLMRLPKEDMLAAVTATLRRYDLGAGLWYPLMEADYADPATVTTELAAADAVYALCARLDAVFVPGGDPGHTPPEVLFPFLERLAAVARRRHPQAEMWVSPQGFRPPRLAEFFRMLAAGRPAWLTGVVYGPWTACTLPEMRAALPEGCPVRLYPDIAHTVHCQFPVVGWDPAYAATLGREPINPRPVAQAALARAQLPGTSGFVTYSEGVNDDVNKFVWTAVGWDPDADVGQVLREYAQLLVAPGQAEALAGSLFALETNWEGPLRANAQVPVTLAQLQAIERQARAEQRANWRLQAALYRGYYDAYVRRRLVAAAAREEQAREWIERGQAGSVPVGVAVAQARDALAGPGGAGATAREGPGLAAAARDGGREEPAVAAVAPHWRARLHELADQLHSSIGIQLSVARHGASATERGANLDALDAPLGDGPWLAATLEGIAALPTEDQRREALGRFDPSHSPGPGGFLDDLGCPGAQPHLVGGMAGVDDPDLLRSVLMVPTPPARAGQRPLPQLWRTAAETLYGVPLVMRYERLDRDARYRVRVLYHGRYRAAVSLEAGEGLPVHGPLRPSDPPAPVTFDLPPAATAGGALTLTWRLAEGRGVQVAAVWLFRARA